MCPPITTNAPIISASSAGRSERPASASSSSSSSQVPVDAKPPLWSNFSPDVTVDQRTVARTLKSIVRNDFDYPSYQSSVHSSLYTSHEKFRSATVSGAGVLKDTIPQDTVVWKPRAYGTSDDSENDDEMPLGVKRLLSEEEEERRRKARSLRRYQREHEEEKWNAGLRTWQERRDEWCGSTELRRRRRRLSKRNSDNLKQDGAKGIERTDGASSSLLVGDASIDESNNNDDDDIEVDEEYLDNEEPMVPTNLPPLIPQSFPIRASIKESRYGEIYRHIVGAGTTPTIPINLRDATRICVNGWKAEGMWPPKSSYTVAVEGGIGGGGRTASTATTGNNHGNSTRGAVGVTQTGLPSKKNLLVERKRSVGGRVKRALGFGGSDKR